ncbi:hypothetical protein FIBSPDRAFT_950956 [Athelia psychrophila]|uniref:Uncharacterized protein n=1 Tax=Athelia psychrophila TaxID=1759441 RepID=A0A166N1E7_9AGAM|nr:hypothetical protein FIBSPDRAFT_950956 [Fibularhizoctonia sp. CBS 109695]
MTSTDFLRPQFDDPAVTAGISLLAIEPLGHGRTRSATVHFTYDIKCPVLWIHGTEDVAYGVKHAERYMLLLYRCVAYRERERDSRRLGALRIIQVSPIILVEK